MAVGRSIPDSGGGSAAWSKCGPGAPESGAIAPATAFGLNPRPFLALAIWIAFWSAAAPAAFAGRPHGVNRPPDGALAGHPRMVDALGDTLPPAPFPRRIVSLSPSVTEILFALGVDSARIVGVTRFCDQPPEAALRPQVGGIVDPSLEAIVARRPDLVLAVRGNPIEVLQRIRSLGIPVFACEDRAGLEAIGEILEQIARLTGPEDTTASKGLLRRFREETKLYRFWSDALPPERRPVVFYADPEFPAWTAGPGSHIDDLISLAGGRNLVRAPGGWPQFSAEQLLASQPEVLLLARPAGADPEALRARLLNLPGWSGLSALRDGRICWIDAATLLRPGPRLLRALRELAACLHGAGPAEAR